MGTALASVISITLLSLLVFNSISNSTTILPTLAQQLNLNNINFVSNDQLVATLDNIQATPEQMNEAVAINTEMRLRALKISLLILAGVALMAIFPAGGLPNYLPGEIPVEGEQVVAQSEILAQSEIVEPSKAVTQKAQPKKSGKKRGAK